MIELIWTKQKPTKAGWQWAKLINHPDKDAALSFYGETELGRVSESAWMWCGPIFPGLPETLQAPFNCAYCGYSASVRESGDCYHVACTLDKCWSGPVRSSKSKAVKAWNFLMKR